MAIPSAIGRALLCACLFVTTLTAAARDYSDSETTKTVLLGSGMPLPDPARRGPAIAIVVNETPYLFDAGEGLWRAIGEASRWFAERLAGPYRGTVAGLAPAKLRTLFLTHLHSDHVVGLPAIMLHPWQFGRRQPMAIYGPPGTGRMVATLLEAYREDIYQRMYGLTQYSFEGWRHVGRDIARPDEVFSDDNVTVEAIPTRHATWHVTYGYRVTTPDKVIVISGDTVPAESLMPMVPVGSTFCRLRVWW